MQDLQASQWKNSRENHMLCDGANELLESEEEAPHSSPASGTQQVKSPCILA